MASTSFFVFMAGDNNLDSSGVDDIQEMCKANPPAGMNVVIQFDRAKDANGTGNGEPTKRLAVENGKLVEKQEIGETNCGDPAVLGDFLQWGTQAYPADRNLVVVWNHGGGAMDEDPFRARSGATRFPLFRPAPERMTVSAKKAELQRAGLTMASLRDPARKRLIAIDETSRDFLDNIELKKALTRPGKKFDIIGFDACLMNMAEVIYQLRDITGIVVGSEETEPEAGWPYDTILSWLKSHPGAGNQELAKTIVDLYAKSYASFGKVVTQSAVSTGDLFAAGPGLDAFAGLLLKSLEDERPALDKILSSVQKYYLKEYIDLYDFVLLCSKNIGNKEIRDAASALLPLLEKSVIASRTQGGTMKNSHGLSIYFPRETPSEEVLGIYKKLDFSGDHPHWLSLILAYNTPSNVER